MTDNALIAATIIGVFAPWLISVIQNWKWPTEVRYIVALATYLVLAGFTQLFTEGFDTTDWGWRDFFKTAALIIISGQSAFKLIWEKGVSGVIEEKTTAGPATT